VDAEILEQTAMSLRILALVGARLEELEPHAALRGLCERAEAAAARARTEAMFSGMAAIGLNAALERAGIPAVPIKGARLAERAYPDPGWRSRSVDIDLLVSPCHYAAARSILASEGYEDLARTDWADGLPHYHARLTPANRSSQPVELHWRVHWYERRFTDSVLDGSAYSPAHGRRLTPRDELALLTLILVRDGFVSLRLAADIAAFWDAHQAHIEPRALDLVIEEHPKLRRALLAGVVALDEVVGIPRRGLVSERWPTGTRARLASALADWSLSKPPHERADDIRLVDLMFTPPSALGVFFATTGSSRWTSTRATTGGAGGDPCSTVSAGRHTHRLVQRRRAPH
jgi:hypothetical protein